jgi:hypothetical protein
MLNIVASNLGLKHAIPITEEHEVVPPSDFKLTPESKNFNISMTNEIQDGYPLLNSVKSSHAGRHSVGYLR